MSISILALSSCVLLRCANPETSSPQRTINFIAGGHAYGSHSGTNEGLYPKFQNALQTVSAIDYLVLVGDIVRVSNEAAWDSVANQLAPFAFEKLFVLGNHDNSDYARTLFIGTYGNTFYAVNESTFTFIILDCQKPWGTIPQEQLTFIKQQIDARPAIGLVFVFFHELLWTQGKDEYSHVAHNFGTYDGQFITNFWGELYPLLSGYSAKKFYIIAGDVAGTTGAIPAFYEEVGNVTLIATGMGQIQDENYLKVSVCNTTVNFSLVALNDSNSLQPLEYYTPANLK